jgi:hypothetical protein
LTGLQQIRDFVLTLPGVEEGPPVKAAHRIAGFKVGGKSFLGIETGEKTMTVSLGEEQGRALAAKHPEAYEEIWRKGETFMGLRVRLSKISTRKVLELVEESWRQTAPERIVEGEGRK